MTLTSFGTPSRSFQPLWTTVTSNTNAGTHIMGTGFQTYPSYLASPGSQNIKRSHKRKSDENLGQSAPKKPRKGQSLGPGPLLDTTVPNLLPELVSTPSTPTPNSRSWGNEEFPGSHLDVGDPDAEKLNRFFAFLQEKLKWTFGELLYHTSKGKSPGVIRQCGLDGTTLLTSNPKEVKRNSSIIQHFMHGRGMYGPADILNNWMQHPYGADERHSHLMYSTSIPYLEIKPVRPALTAFAAQTVKAKLIHEAESAIKLSSGLHVAVALKQQKQSSEMKLEWPDIGAATTSCPSKACVMPSS
jgi:hypothetical protein